jgi:Bacterial capsule synthesis protein PGA_cap
MPTGQHRRPARPGRSAASLGVALLLVVGLAFAARPLLARDRDGRAAGAPPAGTATTPASSRPTGGASSKAATSPSPTPSATARGSLLIHGTGDVSLDPSFVTSYRSQGYGFAWSGLGGLFQRDDLTVVNLECPVSTLGTLWPGKQFNFRGDPAALPFMKRAGVDVANMANNHSYDYGPQALLDTRANLVRNGIAPVGAGRDPAQATEAATFTVHGWRIAVIGIDEVLDPEPQEQAQPGHPGTACGHDVSCMVDAIRRARARADLVVVAIHWGVELDTQPRDYQVEQAHRFVDAGADVVFGGHSHRLQPLETYRGRPIFYSLGNFVWPNFSVAGATTAIAEVRVRPDGAITGRLVPAFIEAAGHPVPRGA